MQTSSRFIFIFVLSHLLSGCITGTLITCVEGQIEREPKPIDKEILFTLEQNKEIKTMQVLCEEYYDVSCSTRGNYWSIRQVGFAKSGRGSVMKVQDTLGETYELEVPYCKSLINSTSRFSLKDIDILAGNKSFRYQSSKGSTHLYKYGGYDNRPLELIELEFILSLNQEPILEPQE